MNREDFMRRAIALAAQGMHAGDGGPFGAVVVKDGRIVGEGNNRVTSANDPTAHAEVGAIRDACRTLGTYSLQGCEIYTSCEPCPMCLAAIHWARIDRIYYANGRADAARIGFDDDHIYGEVAKPIDRQSIPAERLLPGEAWETFAEWQANPGLIRY